MDLEFVLAILAVVAAIGLAVALRSALRRRREVEDVLSAVDRASRPYGPQLDRVARIEAMAAAAERATSDADQARRDLTVLVELLGVGVIRLETRRRVALGNMAAHTILGRTPGTLAGMTATAAFLDAGLEALVDEAARTGSAAGEVHLASSGRHLLVRARWSTDRDLWVVLEDVSELRRLQQIRTEFIDNLSHELRTPLTTVSLLAETLGRDAVTAGDALPGRMRERIAKIEVETGHLVQMVDELMDLSRIESGGHPVLVDEVDLGRLATETTDRLRLFAERQGITLEVDVPEPVAPVRGDADRLGQVLVNLLHNAVKFSPDGSLVSVRVRTDGPMVVTSVIDHGVGIPRSAQGRIFERFYKVDRSRARGTAGGTGLGLAISRHIVEGHGGRIWVQSAPGRGSTFSFSLPVATDVAAVVHRTG